VLVEVWAEYQAAIYAFNLMKLRSKNSAGWLASAQDSDDRKNAPSQFCIGGRFAVCGTGVLSNPTLTILM
jgi:hypothetical protein